MANETCDFVAFDSYRTGVRSCKRINSRDHGYPSLRLIYESGEMDVWPAVMLYYNYNFVLDTIKTNRKIIEFQINGWESYRGHVIGPDVDKFREVLLCLAVNKHIPNIQIHGWFPACILTRTIPYIRKMYRLEGAHLRWWMAVADQIIFQKIAGTAPPSSEAPIYRVPWHIPTLYTLVSNFVGRYVAIEPMFYSSR